MEIANHIFGTDRSLNKYVFKIVREDDEFYYVSDISTTWYELEKNIFTLSKNPLKFVSSENPKFNFIFEKEELFVSFNEDEVRKHADATIRAQYADEYSKIDGVIERTQNEIDELGEVDLNKYLVNADESMFTETLYLYDRDDKKLHPVHIKEKHVWNDGMITIRFSDNDLDVVMENVQYTTMDKENYGTCYVLNVDRYDYGEYYPVEYPIYFSEEHYDAFRKSQKLSTLKCRLNNEKKRKAALERELAKDVIITR